MPNACQCQTPLAMARGDLCGYCAKPLRGTLDTWLPPDPADTFDPTQTPGVDQLPATTTDMTAEQFAQWIHMPGTMYIVYLGERRSFVIKVPDEHHAFFVDMLKQLRLALGPEVQAQSATPLRHADNPLIPRPPERHEIRDSDTCGMGDEYCPGCGRIICVCPPSEHA